MELKQAYISFNTLIIIILSNYAKNSNLLINPLKYQSFNYYLKDNYFKINNPVIFIKLFYIIVDKENYLENSYEILDNELIKLLHYKYNINPKMHFLNHSSINQYCDKKYDTEKCMKDLKKINGNNKSFIIFFLIKDGNAIITIGNNIKKIFNLRNALFISKKNIYKINYEKYNTIVYRLINDIYKLYFVQNIKIVEIIKLLDLMFAIMILFFCCMFKYLIKPAKNYEMKKIIKKRKTINNSISFNDSCKICHKSKKDKKLSKNNTVIILGCRHNFNEVCKIERIKEHNNCHKCWDNVVLE